MTSKEKQYRDLRLAKLRTIVFLVEDLVLISKKSQLSLINLKFLKDTEKEFQRYHDLLIVGSKLPIKIGVSGKED